MSDDDFTREAKLYLIACYFLAEGSTDKSFERATVEAFIKEHDLFSMSIREAHEKFVKPIMEAKQAKS